MNKLILIVAVVLTTVRAVARPHHGGGAVYRRGVQVAPGRAAYYHGGYHHHGHHYHHYRSYNAGAAFVGGVIGGIVGSVVAPRETVVVQQPVVAPAVVQTVPAVQTTTTYVQDTYVPPPVATYVNGVQVISGIGVVVGQPTYDAYVRQPKWVPGYWQDVGQNGQRIFVPGHYE